MKSFSLLLIESIRANNQKQSNKHVTQSFGFNEATFSLRLSNSVDECFTGYAILMLWCFPSTEDTEVGWKWWQILAPGTVLPKLYLASSSSWNSAISSLSITTKNTIPPQHQTIISDLSRASANLHTWSCILRFHQSHHTRWVSMTFSKEWPDCIQLEIFLVVAEIQQVFIIFVLVAGTITRVFNGLNVWEVFPDPLGNYFLELMHKSYHVISLQILCSYNCAAAHCYHFCNR